MDIANNHPDLSTPDLQNDAFLASLCENLLEHRRKQFLADLPRGRIPWCLGSIGCAVRSRRTGALPTSHGPRGAGAFCCRGFCGCSCRGTSRPRWWRWRSFSRRIWGRKAKRRCLQRSLRGLVVPVGDGICELIGRLVRRLAPRLGPPSAVTLELVSGIPTRLCVVYCPIVVFAAYHSVGFPHFSGPLHAKMCF